MSESWLRVCKLVIGNDGGDTLDLSHLRVRFETVTHTTQELASAGIVVSNVSRATYAKVASEFTRISLLCGYERGAPPRVIFSGTITETQYGEKESWTDPLLRIWARDGDSAYNQGRVSRTLSSGWTPQDKLDAAVEALQPFGISLGQVLGVDLSQPKFPRGIPLAGMARDLIREVAYSKGATWNLNGGRVNVVHKDAIVPDGGVVLNSATGMIGQPIQRQDGINVRCLINPSITVDTLITLNQKSIVQTTVTNDGLDASDGALKTDLAAEGVTDGQYRVLQVTTEGDTRGSAWHMNLVCLGAKTGSINATQLGRGLGGGADYLGGGEAVQQPAGGSP